MGGRGAASGIAQRRDSENGGGKSALDKRAAARQITVDRGAAGSSRTLAAKENEILQATESPTGEIKFKNAKPRKVTGGVAVYAVKSGAENGVVFGIKWENVKVVTGATKAIENTLAGQGFKRVGDKWVRR
jgi:hypothetical protein